MNMQTEIQAEKKITEATEAALETTLLKPRFYTTDFEEMDGIDVSPVRAEWDEMIAKMKADPNKGHFKKNEEWDEIDWDAYDPELKAEMIDFLVSSLTAEFSGCVLYKEMRRRGNNPDICELFGLMSRDEARHAGFINDALREAGIGVNLGFLTREKKYTFFRPKFIYYATYLSEKIGYARYITIYRHLEKHPENRIHPIFKWFKEWCNDEFSHGEAFALLMRTDPKLTSGRNVWWIKFFLTAVFSVMWVRDHQRHRFHEALGVDIDDYDRKVLNLTSEISRQIFPIELDMEHRKWEMNLRAMERAFRDMEAGKKKGGIWGRIGQALGGLRAAEAFLSLYMIPSKKNEVPADGRLEPIW